MTDLNTPGVQRRSVAIQDPPTRFAEMLGHLGPGLIISASIVGSGELIVTTKLGADIGFVLLWFIIVGCMIKVFVQVELGRYTLSHTQTTIQAMDSVPGPRFSLAFRGLRETDRDLHIVNFGWLVWCWLLMYVATFFQLAGIVGAIADVFGAGGIPLHKNVLAALITGSCALLLGIGRYRFIESFSTAMVALFTLVTVVAVIALQWTPYAITPEQLFDGLRFRLPPAAESSRRFEPLMVAFAAFGVIGVGASELIYYPYWCLEKGYAKAVGPNDGSDAWQARAKGWLRVMKLDAWVSMIIYTTATIAFYLLGAAVLHGKGLEVSDTNLIENLSAMYRESFGTYGKLLFLVGAFVVLYSTVFVATASNGRLIADLISFTPWLRGESEAHHARVVQLACILLPVVYFLLFWTIGSPIGLVFVGAVAQAIMLPFLCLAVLFFRHWRTAPVLRPGLLWTVLLWIASLLMAATGVMQGYDKLRSKPIPSLPPVMQTSSETAES